jgi:hypothetical protein
MYHHFIHTDVAPNGIHQMFLRNLTRGIKLFFWYTIKDL